MSDLTSEPARRFDDSHRGLEHLGSVAGAASFYIADIEQFRNNVTSLLEEMLAWYPRVELGYSYKTNYLAAFAHTADELGCLAEVVSRMEYDYATRLGAPGARILFNGPVKTRADLKHAMTHRSTIICDSITEAHDAIAVASQLGLDAPARIALRCELDESTPGTRFGIDLTAVDGRDLLRRILAEDAVVLVGIHAHHSGDRSASRYETRTRELISIHQDLLAGYPIEFIDVGGGLGSRMPPELAAQMAFSVPTFREYAAVIAGTMARHYGDEGPELILEPGMALLANTVYFVTPVARVKPTRRGLVAVVDGSIFNVKPLRSSVNMPIEVVRGSGHGRHGTWDFVGHTCMEIDLLHKGHVGEVAEGDLVVMPNVGAYTTVLNAPFIRPLPPIVGLDGDIATLLRPSLDLPYLAQVFGADL